MAKKSKANGAPSRLMYPLITPRGPSGGDGSVRRSESYPTKVVDYLKFTIYESDEGSNSYSYVNGGKSGDGQSKKKIYKTIYLYLPQNLTEQFSTSYERAVLGPFGAAAVEAVRSAGSEGAGQAFVDAIQSGANSAKPEIAFSGVSKIFNGISGLVGVDGSLSKNQLAALAKGKVFNPYEETVFKGVNYRSHNFDFDMSLRNPAEAQAIHQIILELRDSMLPGTDGAAARWLTIPRFFRAEIVRYTPGSFKKRLDKKADKLARTDTLATLLTYPVNMVLTNMQVNMTPNGQNTSLRIGDDGKDYGPAAFRMSLTFDETAFITRSVYKESTGYTSPASQVEQL